MLEAAPAPTVTVTAVRLPSLQSDVIVVLFCEGDPLTGGLAEIESASGGAVSRAIASGEFIGRTYELFLASVAGWASPRVALVGAGKRADLTTERLRRVATAAALQLRQRRVTRLAWLEHSALDTRAAVQAATEGLMLSAFSGDVYKSGERGAPPMTAFTIALLQSEALTVAAAAAERGRILGDCSNLSRQLCNEPSNVLTPSVFAERARAIAEPAGVAVEVLDERRIAELGMGLLLGVARGSAEPPRVIVLRHKPKDAPAAPVLGLVGKGITFDTGGISIKPADGMERMKDDMSGGAAVICAMRAIALLGAPVEVIGIVPTTENMPGGRAIKPGDVLRSASGKTVEVLNTDAEGRLILGDGLWYARTLGATHLVDVATLTGAIVVALGKAAAGIFGRPQPWVDHVRDTALAAGDRCWPMPLFDEYTDQLRSEIADMVNTGGRPGGACTAATFIKEFAGELPWVHLDIAGMAWAEEPKPWQPKGATGAAVRTLAELAFSVVDLK